MIYAALNQKGGAGKTTLAVHLACYLVDRGRRVAFLDADPQQSGRPWVECAEKTVRCESPTTAEAVVDAIARLTAEGHDIVCDGPPRMDAVTNTLMYYADRIIVPVTPSEVDVRATVACKQQFDQVLAAQAKDGVAPGVAFIVVNRFQSTNSMGKMIRGIARQMGFRAAVQTVGLRTCFAQACTDDTVVTRMKKNKMAAQAAVEINALFQEICHVEPAATVAA